jgi:hypothetical protein
MALVTALTTDMVYRDVTVFHHAMNALNGTAVNFDTWDPVDMDELAWGLAELAINDTPESQEEFGSRFSPDVRRYVGLLSGDGKYAAGSLPAPIAAVADLPQARSGSELMADDPTLFGAASDKAAAESAEAEAYASARMTETFRLLETLPLSSRAAGWRASAASALEGSAR